MKTTKNLLMMATMAALLIPALHLKADRVADGMVASPKMREQMESWRTVPSLDVYAPSTTVAVNDGILAPPRLREHLESFRKVPVSPDLDLAHPQWDDGVVASPKAREQMSPGGTTIQIAPIK